MGCELILMLAGYFLLVVSDEVELNTTAVAMHRNVVSYIGVRFTPRVLRLSQDTIATGKVQVTDESHHFSDNWVHRRLSQPALHACIVDPSVATASWSTVNRSSDRRRLSIDVASCSLLPAAVYDSSQSEKRAEVAAIYFVTVRGVLIGRSAVRFYVTKTQTSSKIAAAAGVVQSDVRARATVTQYNANSESDKNASDDRVVCNVTVCRHWSRASYDVSVTIQRWWLSDECQIVVVSPVQQSTANVLCYVLITLTAVNLVSIGGQLDCDEAIQLLRRPSSLAVGLFCRFALIPAVSLHQY